MGGSGHAAGAIMTQTWVEANLNFPFAEPPWPHSHPEFICSSANDWTVRCVCGFWAGPFSRKFDATMAWDDHLADG